MPHRRSRETIVDRRVTYALEVDGRLVAVENVPARECLETGERFFAPDTVERLQELVGSHTEPTRIIETPVYEFAR